MFDDKIIKGEGFVMIDPKDYELLVLRRVYELEQRKEDAKLYRKLFGLSLVLGIYIGLVHGSRQ